MKTITIKVTAEDIKQGTSKTTQCPIARACRKAGIKHPIVYGWCFGEAPELVCEHGSFALPKKARRFVDDFDSGEEAKPFSFKIKAP